MSTKESIGDKNRDSNNYHYICTLYDALTDNSGVYDIFSNHY
jgi:hypothetical protein